MPDKTYEEFILDKVATEQEKKPDPNRILTTEAVTLDKLTAEEGIKSWVWENYLAKGHITLLSSLWKAGKSTLIRSLLRAMNEGEEFAGQPTTNNNVLILSEETRNEWYDNREFFNLDKASNVFLLIRAIKKKPTLKEWIQLVDEMQEICVKEKVGLVIIDTIATFMPIQNENDAGEWTPALVPLYSFTDSEVNKSAVLLVHHFRKAGGNEATASRGSGALPGFVSNIIEFTRKEGSSRNTERILKTYGRFPDVIPEVVINYSLDDGKYTYEGVKWEVSKKAKFDRIRDILKENTYGLSIKDISRLWETNQFGNPPNIRSLQRYVNEMIFEGEIVQVKEETVVSRITPFYALKGTYHQQIELATTSTPPPMASVVTLATEVTHVVASFPKNEAKAHDTTDTTVVDNTNGKGEMTPWNPEI